MEDEQEPTYIKGTDIRVKSIVVNDISICVDCEKPIWEGDHRCTCNDFTQCPCCVGMENWDNEE